MNKVICLMVFFLGLLQSGFAYPPSMFDIGLLVESSDFIGVCEVMQTALEKPTVDESGRFEVKCIVLSTIKGRRLKNITIETFLDWKVNYDNKGFGTLKNGDIDILFLKESKKNIFDFAVNQHPKISLVKFYDILDTETNNAQEKISMQLMQALDSDNPKEVTNAIFWLTEMKEDIPQDKLLEFSKSENKDLRVASLRRLIRYKNKAAIRDASLWLLTPNIHKEISQSQFAELAWTLESEASSVDLDLANRLAASSNDIVQRIGVRILKEVGDSSSIPYLVLALDAENNDTKRSAVVALTRITGKKVSGSSWHEFMKNPSAETQKWKTWWQEESKKKRESELSYRQKSTVTNSIKSNVSK
jgi:hypothetical protein